MGYGLAPNNWLRIVRISLFGMEKIYETRNRPSGRFGARRFDGADHCIISYYCNYDYGDSYDSCSTCNDANSCNACDDYDSCSSCNSANEASCP